MAVSIIKHNGKEVLLIDHHGLAGDALYESMKEANKFVLEKRKNLPLVADFTDTTATKVVNDYLQSDETKTVAQYISKQAIVGLSGIKKMMLRLYNVFTGVKSGVFDTVEEAKDYVTKL